jgi:hypothetical protein
MSCTLQGGQVKEDEVGGAFNTVGEMRNVYIILAGKPEGDHVQTNMRSGDSSVKLSEVKEDKDSAGVTSRHLEIKNRSSQRRIIFFACLQLWSYKSWPRILERCRGINRI